MHASKVTVSTQRQSFGALPWAVIVTVAGLLATGVAYALADAYNNAYLEAFFVQPDAFPIDHPRHLVLALWAALNASVQFGHWIGDHWRSLLMLLGILVSYAVVWVLMGKALAAMNGRISSRLHSAGAWLQASPHAKKFLRIVVAGVPILYLLMTLPLFLPVVLSIPSAIGEAAGQYRAAEVKAEYDKGCAHSTMRCYQVLKNGQELACGYVVAQSPTLVALFYRGGTRQLPLSDTVMQTTMAECGASRQ